LFLTEEKPKSPGTFAEKAWHFSVKVLHFLAKSSAFRKKNLTFAGKSENEPK
jgi:hypothetical protein